MSVQTPAPSPRPSLTPARAKHNIAGVFAQYIQDLTRPVADLARTGEPAPCTTCP